jgi:hypothetical protein
MLKYIMDRFRPRVVREDTSQKIVDLLFPPVEEVTMEGQTFLTDFSIDSNLYAALVDLEDGVNDATTRDTLKKCYERLQEARRLLLADKVVPAKAKYLVVDSPK